MMAPANYLLCFRTRNFKIELVSRHTLPRTTSGKLARAKARQEYINRMARTAKTVRYARV
jgi:hypothetical protein